MNVSIGTSLTDWGWDERWAGAFELAGATGCVPARVTAQHRGQWSVATATGELPATLTGRFRHSAADGDLPAVGDWVACAGVEDGGEGRIDAVLPRRSEFRRRNAGSRVGAQTVGANIDTLFVASSLNRDLNAGRLERYVAMGLESGAEPVVLLTKADLRPDSADVVERLEADLRVAVIALSALSGEGLEAVSPWFKRGRTLALVGSSGVGKSTLLNRLAGEELMETRDIREDDARGRHTTTHRELFRLPGGALVLDTPGMRELGLWDAEEGLAGAFGDVEDLAARCRFRDCGHKSEPGCAVMAAVKDGSLDAKRLRRFRLLARELHEQPSPIRRQQEERQFGKMVRNASADSMARKTYRW
jgi:ribosome biogenesis GTPase